MAKRDYYEVLGISRGASEDDIKSSYRRMAMQYHPDRNPNDKTAEEKFKEATEAYEILKDSQKRQTYDQFGHEGLSGSGFGGGGGGFGFGGFDLSDALRAFMRDFGGGFGFDDFFGSRSSSEGQNRGEDLRAKVALTLKEISTGTEKTLKVRLMMECDECSGSGVAPGTSRNTCPECRGAGQVRTISKTFLGTIQQIKTCPRCRGGGEVISNPCPACRGEGRLRGEKKVNVKIPAGVSTGNYMTLENQGNAARNKGLPGHLNIIFDEIEHDIFTRQGDNVVCQFPISFTLAALGGELFVPTLDGDHRVKIPPGTQSGKVFRLKGKGIPRLNSYGTGDELVQVTVWTPTKLSEKDKNLLNKLHNSESFRPPKANKSFFQKLRETLGI